MNEGIVAIIVAVVGFIANAWIAWRKSHSDQTGQKLAILDARYHREIERLDELVTQLRAEVRQLQLENVAQKAVLLSNDIDIPAVGQAS